MSAKKGEEMRFDWVRRVENGDVGIQRQDIEVRGLEYVMS